jgi:hypothetical protein
MAATVEIDEINGAPKITGTATSTSVGNLVSSSSNFTTAAVSVGDLIRNTTDSTFAYVTAVTNATTLALSADIFTNGKSFSIQGVTTHDISNTNMGSVDAPNLVPVSNPIVPGQNTFEKYQRFHVTAMGGSSLIDSFKVWRTGALGGAAVHVTNARTASYVRAAYATPTAAASSVATQTMPVTEPVSPNLGINGSLAGGITASGGVSDLLVHQIKTNVADTTGSTSTLNYQFDEVA